MVQIELELDSTKPGTKVCKGEDTDLVLMMITMIIIIIGSLTRVSKFDKLNKEGWGPVSLGLGLVRVRSW